MKKADGQSKTTVVDTLIVGAGPAGLIEARKLLKAGVGSFAVLESSDRVLGRAAGGLHLLNADKLVGLPLQAPRIFSSAKIRWEKQWVSFEDVDWTDDDWIASLPQWTAYLRGPKAEFSTLDAAAEIQALIPVPNWLHLNTPVSSFERVSDTADVQWRALTPTGPFLARRVIWAAGMPAFQNAFGKIEAQEFLDGNPLYQKDAGDFVGGLSLEIEFHSKPRFEEGFDENAVFGLPVRHDGKLSLLIGVLVQSNDHYVIKTLTHVHLELLSDPKELLSFQKSLRRAIKHITRMEDDTEFDTLPERWVVSPKVGGHMLGNAWCFGPGEFGSLEFVGDQTLASLQGVGLDIVGLLTQSLEAGADVATGEASKDSAQNSTEVATEL